VIDKELHLNSFGNTWERETRSGWSVYRQAIELLRRDEWLPALRLLAEAETIFRMCDDAPGLWRALAGQTAAHWRMGDAALALARASAALRTATAAADQIGAGVVGWQIAVLHLHQEAYQTAAQSLRQTQEVLSPKQAGAASTSIVACAQLCHEVDRWIEMYSSRLIARRTAEQVITAIQRDLAAHLEEAGAALRLLWGPLEPLDDLEQLLLRPSTPEKPPLGRLAGDQHSLSARLSRWWNNLVAGPQREEPPLVEAAAPAPPEPPQLLTTLVEARGEHELLLSIEAALAHAAGVLAPQVRTSTRLAVNCFGRFRVALDDQVIERWESARGRTIFKYLITRRGAAVPKELLADMFWPESEPELARRSLHQAIYCLRQSFKRIDPDLAIVLFNGDCYQINPELSIWVDSEEFSAAISQARASLVGGQTAEAMRAYGVAADLVGGEFLEEDRYEAWAEELRQSYRVMVAEALRHLSNYHFERGDYAMAILFSQRLLAQDSCDEEAHLMLMRCHVAQGLRHLAVRQYQIYVHTLKHELGLSPSDEIDAFYQQVLALA
jgi:DNA-binding SARP family transcriptional activator